MTFTSVQQPVIIQELASEWVKLNGVQLFMRREDLIDPVIPGNKWRKLYYNLHAARQAGHDQLLTFGGAYSNHIHAVAGACKRMGLRAIGIIRGEEHTPANATLHYAKSCGMHLHYISREEYRRKKSHLGELEKLFGAFYYLPEGGTNCLAIRGCAEMMDTEMNSMDVIAVPVGTGGTLAGLISGASSHQYIYGFSSLKGDFLYGMVEELLKECGETMTDNWEIDNSYHFGGYARGNEILRDFLHTFKLETGVLLDPVYTGKMMYGLKDQIIRRRFPRGTRICAIHTGGLQGWQGFSERFGWKIPR